MSNKKSKQLRQLARHLHSKDPALATNILMLPSKISNTETLKDQYAIKKLYKSMKKVNNKN